jgi:hypothetical protein
MQGSLNKIFDGLADTSNFIKKKGGGGYSVSCHFQQYFSYIMVGLHKKNAHIM